MRALNRIKEVSEESVKYAQQHLANERTYLAWIRTSVSIIGVGFLTTSLHFTIKMSSNSQINTLAIFLGILACIVGFSIGILATVQYSNKRKAIQQGIFIASNYSIVIVAIMTCFLIFFILLYLACLLLQ
jgi:putative membrane protein